MFNNELLISSLKKINIELSDKQVDQLKDYCSLLIEKNKVMNLTAITDVDEIISKHFVDSALINSVVPMTNGKIIDVGTGEGFPGLVLKIVFPELEVVLLDSLDKRIKFLDEVIEKLGLENVYTIHGRAEDFGRDESYREQFDYCVSRAVANLSVLAEYCIPFVKEGGKFVSYKSANSEEEINQSSNAIKVLGGELEKVETVSIPETDIDRTFAIINKVNCTDNKYPRRAGKPTKKPL